VSGDSFGSSISISANKAIVGSSASRSAYVVEYKEGTWLQTQKIKASGGEDSDKFGSKVSIENDVILVSASYYNELVPNDQRVAAYIFELQNNVWVQTQKLISTQKGNFATDVKIENNQLFISFTRSRPYRPYLGSVYIYEKINEAREQVEIIENPSTTSTFGEVIDVSGDYLFVYQTEYDYKGTVFIYKHVNGVWEYFQKVLPSDIQEEERFRRSIAVEGGTAVFGTWGYQGRTGSAYVYELIGDVWEEYQKLTPSDGTVDTKFGEAVANSNDKILVGAPWGFDGTLKSGKLNFFS
jgi:hypothetical protein